MKLVNANLGVTWTEDGKIWIMIFWFLYILIFVTDSMQNE